MPPVPATPISMDAKFTHVPRMASAKVVPSAFSLSMALTVERGELIAVTGAVAAGKSSLLLAVLGEMATETGNTRRPANSAGCACGQRDAQREQDHDRKGWASPLCAASGRHQSR